MHTVSMVTECSLHVEPLLHAPCIYVATRITRMETLLSRVSELLTEVEIHLVDDTLSELDRLRVNGARKCSESLQSDPES